MTTLKRPRYSSHDAPALRARASAAAALPAPARRTGLLAALAGALGLIAQRVSAREPVVVKEGWFLAARDR